MRFYQNGKDKNIKDNRANKIMAIIFLLGAGVSIRLFDLQVLKHDLYSARAEDQHQISSILKPKRGRIFIQDKSQEGGLYPIASNKNFVHLYAVPKEAENKEALAENLFVFLKQEALEKELENFIKEDNKERLEKELALVSALPEEERLRREEEIKFRYEALLKDPTYLSLQEEKKRLELERRKKEIISGYLLVFAKANDPYEPLEKKVEEEVVKKMFLNIASSTNPELGPIISAGQWERVKIKNDQIFYTDGVGQEKGIAIKGLGLMEKVFRFYPENNIGSHFLGFVGWEGDEERGRYGLEGFFDQELYGRAGSITAGRGASGNIIIVNDREYEKPVDGSDFILTIDRTIQFKACRALSESAERHGADSGSVIIMEPKTGAIMAMCSWPDYDPNKYGEVEKINIFNNPAIFHQYEPGSTFKAITMAAAVSEEKVSPSTVYEDKGSIMINGWDKPIKNSDFETHGGHGLVNMTNVLESSLNTGAIFAMEQIGAKTFASYLKKFGFGEKTGVELETESKGSIKELENEKIKEIYAATASFGQGITVTPIQMLAAYAAIANGGTMVKPYLVKEIIQPDGRREETKPRDLGRVITPRAATLLSGMLTKVIESGHATRAGVKGYYVAGKTGTAQVADEKKRGYGSRTIHTFVGFAPAEEPRFVAIVKLDDPKDVKFADSSAAPLFSEIAGFLLNYLEVPRERN